jgi:hypothetical protein
VPAAGRGVRARGPAARDAHGHGERRGPHPHVHAAGEPGPPGRDHPGDQRDRVGRRRARLLRTDSTTDPRPPAPRRTTEGRQT